MAQTTRPLLVELDQGTWTRWLERVEPWLATTATLQGSFGKLLEDTIEDVAEPHWHAYLEEILASARDHEAKIDQIYQAFGREPSGPGRLGSAAATLVAKGRQAVGHAEGLAAGARGNGWRKLRQLLVANLDAISGFAVTEQLGLPSATPRSPTSPSRSSPRRTSTSSSCKNCCPSWPPPPSSTTPTPKTPAVSSS